MSCPNCTCESCQRKQALKQELRSQQAARALELRAQGLTLPRIAELIGSSQPGVCKLLREARQ